MKLLFSRLYREKLTIEKMIKLFCKFKHYSNGRICNECEKLLRYAIDRIEHCPYSVLKPVCNKCPIHCYKKEMRAKVIAVMRFSGPRMLRYHPILAMLHLVDKQKSVHKINNISKQQNKEPIQKLLR
ncbi:MAG: nitrous oxide-stimulated promoter family protein [Ignavibacteria bacterium]|nr:nitrous oxide-stimulated promoter family protein [Ignavibacteria bacterium]